MNLDIVNTTVSVGAGQNTDTWDIQVGYALLAPNLQIAWTVAGPHERIDDANTSWIDNSAGGPAIGTFTIFLVYMRGAWNKVYNIQLTTMVNGDSENGMRREPGSSGQTVLVGSTIDVDYHLLRYSIDADGTLKIWIKRLRYSSNDSARTSCHILVLGEPKIDALGRWSYQL